jgi:spore maturation protein CgeB
VKGSSVPLNLLLVGNPQQFHVGAHFWNGAKTLAIATEFLDVSAASGGSLWWRRFNWRLLGRRPTRLCAFSQKVVETCRQTQPDLLLTTGLAPVSAAAMRQIGQAQIRRLNFLTDDPWNPAHRAKWFFDSLGEYDYVFSTRQANLGNLRALGCRGVHYLPFAYAPEIHYPEPQTESARALQADLTFAGGADADRIPYFLALAEAGFSVALYGHDWEKNPATKQFFRGHADPSTLRKVVAAAKMCLCLVRRANRDGHAMRSFEVPAMGGCMLTEDTEEHREIFGAEGHAVVYFNSIPQMVEKARWLLAHPEERQRLASAAHALITGGKNTYADRLQTILQRAEEMAGRDPSVGEPGGVGNHHEA